VTLPFGCHYYRHAADTVPAARLRLPCPDSLAIYSGRERQLDVRIPRFDAEVVIDGDLSDPAWARAALLTASRNMLRTTAFRRSTRPRCWCGTRRTQSTSGSAPTSCTASHGDARERDQIFGDDNVQILLGTFHDSKKALMFAVNPLGVQGDGALIEGRTSRRAGSSVVRSLDGSNRISVRTTFFSRAARHAVGL